MTLPSSPHFLLSIYNLDRIRLCSRLRAASVLDHSCSFALLPVDIAVADADACPTAHVFCCSNHPQLLPFPSIRMFTRTYSIPFNHWIPFRRRLEASTNGAVALAEVPHRRYRLDTEIQMMASELGMGSKSACRRTLTHLAASPRSGNVYPWADICPSGSTPYCLALSHSALNRRSRLLAAADSRGYLAVFDPTAGSSRLPDFCPHVQAHASIINDIDWACDDSFIATASADGTACISCVTDSALQPHLNLRHSWNNCQTVACHPRDVNLLASGAVDGLLCVWDTRSRKTAMIGRIGPRLPHPLAADSQDCISPRRSVSQFLIPHRGASTQSRAVLDNIMSHHALGTQSVTGIEFVNDVSMISSSCGGNVCIWDVRNFCYPVLTTKIALSPQAGQTFAGRGSAFTSLRVSPCRTRVALLTKANRCMVLSLPDLQHCIAVPLGDHPWLDRGTHADWSPCGQFVACGSNDHDSCVHIIDVMQGSVVLRMLGHSNVVTDVVWFKDQSGLISVSHDGDIRVWNPQTAS